MAAPTKAELQARVAKLERALAREKKRKGSAESLARARAAQAATARILRVVRKSPSDVQPVFEAIAAAGLRLFDAWIVTVIRYDGTNVLFGATRGALPDTESYVRALFPHRPRRTNSVGRCILTRDVVNLADAQRDRSREMREIARVRGFRATLVVPLMHEGAPIGAIAVQRATAGAFSDDDVALLRGFADQAVIAIENTRRFHQTQEALERQTATADILKVISGSPEDVQPVFDAVARSSMRLLGALSASVSIRVGDSLQLGAFTSTSKAGDRAVKGLFPLSLTDNRETILAQSVLKAAPAQIGDAQGTRRRPRLREIARRRGFQSIIAVPMLSKGTAIGTVSVTRREAGGFSDHEVELLTTFADQAVIAIENVRLFNETKEALEHQTATSDVLRVISTSPTDVQPVLDAIAESAARLCESSDAQVLLCTDSALRIAAQYGSEIRDTVGTSLPLDRDSATARAVIDSAMVHVADVSALPAGELERTKTNAAASGWQSILSVPLLRDGAAVGAIAARRSKASAFTPRQIALLKTFADQAVIAIENVRLFNETKEALERQTATAEILKVISGSPTDVQPVLEAVAERAAHLCAATDAHVWRREGDALQAVAGYGGRPILRPRATISRQSVMGRTVIDGEPVHVLDLPAVFESEFPDSRAMMEGGNRTVLGIPLMHEGTAIGGILIRRTTVSPFSDQQIALLQTFADQAVIAIENVRLFNETKEALERQTATAEILKVISGSPTNIQPVLDAVAENAARLCEASDAIIQLREGDRLRFAAHYGEIPNMPRDSVREISRELVTGRAVLDGRQIHIHDLPAETEDYPLGSKISAEFGYHTILATPLMREGTAIGTIMVRRTEVRPFSDKHLALVSTFADQAVIAIENVRLFNETKESLERQTATAEVLGAISASPTDTQPVFDIIAERAVTLCGARDSAVMRYDGTLVHLAAFYNLAPEAGVAMRHAFPCTLEHNSAGIQAIRTGQVVQFRDVSEIPEYHLATAAEAGGSRRLLAVPLLRGGEPIGAVVVAHGEPGQFPDHQVGLVKTFADQAVIAIENVRLFNETKEALERQTATAEILKVISSSPTDVQPVFDAIADSAMRLCGGDQGLVFTYDGTLIHIGSLKAMTPEEAEPLRSAFPAPPGRGSASARAILTRKIVQIPDVLEDPEYELKDISKFGGWRSNVSVPMLRDGIPIGTITVNHRDPRPFSDAQVALLQTFADQAVIAIENVRLFNETKEALERQTATAEILEVMSRSQDDLQPVFDTIADNTIRLCDSDQSAVGVYDGELIHLASIKAMDPDQESSTRQAWPRPPGRGSGTSRAVLTRSIVHIPDVLEDPDYELGDTAQAGGWRSVVSVPMLRGGSCIGAITAMRRNPGLFSEVQIALLKTFADQAVIAIQNVRLFNETKEALERQTATGEILSVISGSPTDVQPVFDTIVKNAVELSNALFSAVYRFDGERLHLVAHHNYTPEVLELENRVYPMRPDRGQAVGRAILDRELVHIPDALIDPDYQHDIATTGGWRSMVAIPMFREGTPLGVIWVARAQTGPFSKNQLDLLRTFADQAVIAIENVRLFNETKEALERQTATAEILRVISSSPTDVQPVFDMIGKLAGKLCAADITAVARFDGEKMQLVALEGVAEDGVEFIRRAFPMYPGEETVIARAFQNRDVEHVADVMDNPSYARKSAARASGFRGCLGVPMIREGNVIGVIFVARVVPGYFADSQVALLKTFADQAVIAIENVRLFNDTKEALERQTATAEILEVMSRSQSDLQPVFDTIAGSAMHLCDGDQGLVYSYDGALVHIASLESMTPEGEAATRELFPMPASRGYGTGRAILTRAPVQVADVFEDPEYEITDTARVSGWRSVLAVPMLRSGNPIGAIAVVRRQPMAFTDNEVALLKTFADQAVIAIENVRLFNETNESLERQTATADILRVISSSPTDVQPVFDSIARSARQLIGGRSAAVVRRIADQLHLEAVTATTAEADDALRKSFPTPLTGRAALGKAILSGQPAYSADVETDEAFSDAYRETLRARGTRSFVAVPMMREGEAVGGIAVTRGTAGPFSDHQINLLQTFADQAVIAIENVRLFNETKDALERQTATAEILRVISASPTDVQPVFDAIVTSAARLCDAVQSAAVTREDGMLRLVAHKNWTGEGRNLAESLFPMPVDRDHLTAIAVRENRVIHSVNLQQDPEAPATSRELAIAQGYDALLIVPMLREGRSRGAVVVARRSPFTDHQITLLQTFADQAVIAIDNVRLFNETREALERQTATAEILKVISSSPTDVQPVFDAVAENSMRLLGALSASVTLRSGDQLQLAAYTSTNPSGDVALQQLFPMSLTDQRDRILARAVLSGAPVAVSDTEGAHGSPTMREMGRKRGYRSLLAVPMLSKGVAIGTIAVTRLEAGEFSDHDIELLATFAHQAVIAIDNVRLFNETREALERQTATAEILRVISTSPTDVQPVFDAIVANAARLCDAAFSAVARFDGGLLHLSAVNNMSPEEEEAYHSLFPRPPGRQFILGRAFVEGRPVHVEDIEADPEYERRTLEVIRRAAPYRTYLGIPIVREGVPIGVIGCGRREIKPFTPAQIELVKTFADQAVIAIENVRLFNETKEALEQQRASGEVLSVISNSIADAQPVFEKIVESCERLFAGSKVGLNLVGPDGLVHAGAYGKFPGVDKLRTEGFPHPANAESATGAAILARDVIHYPDVLGDPNVPFYARRGAEAVGFRSFIMAPLLSEGRGLGAIFVGRETVGTFTEKETALLKTFANQAVIAIQNARLFNETKEALEQQTATSDVLQVISRSTFDLQPVFDTLVENAVRLCGAQTGMIFQRDGAVMRLAAAHGASDRFVDYVQEHSIALDRISVTGRVALEARTTHVLDATSDPEYGYGGQPLENYRTIVGVPLLRDGEAVGVFTLWRHKVEAFTPRQIALVETFADQAVIAIENVRLFNETKEALERQTATAEILQVIGSSPTDTQPVFDAIVNSGVRLFPGAMLSVARPEGGTVRAVAIAHEDTTMVAGWRERFTTPLTRDRLHAAAILDAKLIDIPDAEAEKDGPLGPGVRNFLLSGNRAVTVMPMLRGEGAIGAISVVRAVPGPLSDKQIAILRTFADQAVIAIENVRLFNETKEALEQQTATAEILKVISASPTEVQPVFDAIVHSALHIFAGTSVGIGLTDGDRLRFVASGGKIGSVPSDLYVPRSRDSVTGLAVLDRATVNIRDTEAPDAPSFARENGRKLGFRSMAATPLMREGEAVGALAVYMAEPGGLAEKQITLLNTFADQAVIAIENTRLFRELQERTEALTKSVGQLTALGDVSQAISSTLDLEKVLQTIVLRAVQLTGMDSGAIYEYDENQRGFRLRSAENLPEEVVGLFRTEPMPIGEGAIGRAGLTHEAVQIPDIHAESYKSRVRDLLIRSGSRALLAVPLLREGHLLGALAVTRNRAGEFAPETVELLRTFATQSAIAIQNARLFREIEEKARQLAEASQHKSQFLASMSHELRTPLNAILGFNEMLLGEVYGEVPTDMKEPLEDIQTSGKHLLRLINNVLDLAKIEAGRMELALADYSVHDMVESVRTTLRPLAEAKGLEFLASVPNDLPLAHGDSGRLTQCLMNLAGNSLKFTKEGNVSISVEPNGETLAFRVSDTGIGIPPDKIDHLFTEFRQTDATIASEYGGTGLGLSITKKFIEMHGGRIWVESELGKGSSFIFEIPLRVEAGATA